MDDSEETTADAAAGADSSYAAAADAAAANDKRWRCLTVVVKCFGYYLQLSQTCCSWDFFTLKNSKFCMGW